MNRRSFLFSTTALAAVACTSEPPVAAAPGASIAPWEPANAAFAGCHGACGAHAEAATEGVIVQPGAHVGDRTFCPVSGAVFVVEATHPSARIAAGTLWFCCEGCATYFAEHRDEVLRMRGIA